ncbi:lectin [Roridomyces roridus]|uniref:Lectin n=1 Tax=Roridomyces roridus TaxID=1738132 RepID=A0AAD7B5S7_9AGAR|nr:lectin [Roridomyces roridus]
MVYKFFLTIAFAALALIPPISALDLQSSTWIWTNEVSGGEAPAGNRAFRKDFVAPLGKTPVQADILLTVDNIFTFYVNGIEAGSGRGYNIGHLFCVAMSPCLNVFAVNATNEGPGSSPAGLVAAIQITYSDGTTTNIVTDTTWLYSTTVPSGFEQLSFDDSSWKPAIGEGAFGISPWGPTAQVIDAPTLSIANASWIWTNEVVGGNAPSGNRAFRRTYTPPPGQTPTSATIIISADDAYSLYVNGVLVGSGNSWGTAQTYSIGLAPAANYVFAVFAQNQGTTPNPAGLIAAIQINIAQCDCAAPVLFVTDGEWTSNTGTPAGFQLPGFDDSTWPAATIEGPFGISPWGNISVGGPGAANPIPGAPN